MLFSEVITVHLSCYVIQILKRKRIIIGVRMISGCFTLFDVQQFHKNMTGNCLNPKFARHLFCI